MPRLVRRQPLSERIKAYLDPYDFLLWIAEELHESAWDEALKDWAAPIGLAANIVIIIARANSGTGTSRKRDDVFGDFDGEGESGWFAWLVSVNARYDMLRADHFLTRLYLLHISWHCCPL